jgi:tetratricopeptide (TPR) repeat protein
VTSPLALLLLLASSAPYAAETYSPGSAEDPEVRMAKFYGEDKRYFTSVSELLKIQKDGGDQFEAAPEFWSQLAEYYLSWGMRDRSEAIYRTVAGSAKDVVIVGKARLRLAEFEYDRGYYDEARASLLRAREKLPKELTNDWKDLYSRVLLAQGRFSEAVGVLEKVDGDEDPQGSMRYNYAIALISSGQVAQGRTILDRLGRTSGRTQEIMAMRDRANTTLGWHFLQNRLGGSAKPVLQRVRSEGMYANRALLGVGWAETVPAGKRQTRGQVGKEESTTDPFRSFSALGILIRRGYLDDPYERAGLRSFRRSGMAKDEEDGLRRALVPWLELVDRDPQDPAVQEAWLAIPYALDKLGAHTQAVKYYEQAATRLEESRKRTIEEIAAIRGGRMVETIVKRDADAETGWTWELRDLPDAPETYALQSTIAEHGFAEGLKNFRDTRLMLRNLDGWKERIDQMDVAFKNKVRPPVDPVILFARAKKNYKPAREKLDLVLVEDPAVAAPGRYDAAVPKVSVFQPELKLSGMPAKFDGPYERLQSLKKRVDGLRDPLKAAGAEQNRQLQKMSLDELNAQKSQVEKYLVETRFSLARLYDRALPEEDQDEVEVDKSGKKPVKLQRGEREIDKSKPLADQLRRPAAPSATQDEYEVK